MYTHILVPVDGSPTSNRGLDEAVKLCKLTGGKLKLIHVVDELLHANGFESYPAYAGEVIPMMKKAGQQVLQRARLRAETQGVVAETAMFETIGQRVADVVAEQAQAWGADLVVLGTHGRRGASRFFMGSDAEQVARSSRVPVLLVRLPEEGAASERADGETAVELAA